MREDCWTEEATFTLMEAWGDRYLDCNRGSLRQKQWREVADAVNEEHAYSKATRRTDVQCKNRIDTLKKKYKIEKARAVESGAGYVSTWPYFARLDELIGSVFPAGKKPSPALPLAFSPSIPVAPRSATQKRPAPSPEFLPLPAPPASKCDFSQFHRINAFAEAAAAAAEAEAEEDGDGSEGSGWRPRSDGEGTGKKKRNRKVREEAGLGLRKLAEAIEKFAETYKRVEGAKQRHMIELEKQRMQFATDLEFQRMQLIVETQLQLQKLKRARRDSSPGE